MPKATLEDGTQVDVPSQEELKALQDQAAAATTLQQKVDAERKEWEAEKARLEQEVNPNWKALRDKEKDWIAKEADYKKQLETFGGKPPEATPLTREEVEKISDGKARQVAIETHRDALLSKYSEETRKVVKHYYDKLSAGEEMTLDKVNSIISAAENAAGVAPQGRSASLP